MMHYIDEHLVRIAWLGACSLGSLIWAIVSAL